MTLYVKIGRRMVRRGFVRYSQRINNLLNGQEQIWRMIHMAMSTAKRRANSAPEPDRVDFVKTEKLDHESLQFDIEWILITIKGRPEQELEEYDESMKMYDALSSRMRKIKIENPHADALQQQFKTKRLSVDEVNEAYAAGYGAMRDKSIASKLLELGILTHVKLVKDYDTRDKVEDKTEDAYPVVSELSENI